MKRSLRRCWSPLLVLAALSGCTEPPNGPPTLLLTVSALPAQALDADSPLAPFLANAVRAPIEGPGAGPQGGDPALALGSIFAGAALPAPSGAPARISLPGSLETLTEFEARAGIETASFVTDHAFDEEYGFQQGIFLAHDMAWIELNAEAGWLETAVAGAREYLAQKLPRPMEDAPFVWLHLDLGLIDSAAQRAPFVATVLSGLSTELAQRPDNRVILIALPKSAGEASSVAAAGTGLPAGVQSTLTPAQLGQLLPSWLGQTIEAGVARPATPTKSASNQGGN